MRPRRLSTVFVGSTVLLSSLAARAAAEEELWLHIHVREAEDRDQIEVNLPLRFLEQLLAHEALQGKLTLGGFPELQDLIEAVTAAADGEYFNVKTDEEHVRVVKQKDTLSVFVDDGEERVRAELPLELATALAGSGENGLDLRAALKSLQRHAGRELVRIESEDELVRIWVDTKASTK